MCRLVSRFAERTEQFFRLLPRDALSMIAHAKHGEFSIRQRFEVDDFFRRVRSRVFASVIDEVENNLLHGGNIDVDHGASYGKTIFWGEKAKVPPYLRLANVQFDIDAEKFYKIYIDLMTRTLLKR